MTSSLDPTDPANFAEIWHTTLNNWLNADARGDNSDLPTLSASGRSLLRHITPVVFINGIAVLTTPNQWTKTQVEQYLTGDIQEVLERAIGSSVTLSLSVKEVVPDEPAPQPEPQPESSHQPEPEATERSTQQDERARILQAEHLAQLQQDEQPATHSPQKSTYGPRGEVYAQVGMASENNKGIATAEGQQDADSLLNKKYTFESFVIGGSNQFAHAACRAVAEAPARAYNPLFIWGESGLGKTHLLHAIGHYAQELQPGMRVRYVSSEELTNDFINSIANDRREEFKRQYRNLDMLIVDDIQFLQGKESTQEEFFHTFNALHQANKQIVLSSDRPPLKLNTLEDRLRTRFEGGLITDVQTPDLETRMAILSRKASAEGTALPEDVLELIASRYETSIRELEGALIRVTAYCSLGKEPITREAAEIALRDIMPVDNVQMTPQIIIDVVSSYYDLTVDELVGKGRAKRYVQARQIAMYLCRELTDLSLPKLGAAFGGRDHTTVMHAERRIRKQLTEDRTTFNEVQKLTQRAKTSARG